MNAGRATRSRRRPARPGIPLGLAALCFGIAILQRPGERTADTKIDLHVDPAGFLGDVASVWTNTGALGEVQGGQYAGYLFPMGPFFALGHLAGLPDWLVSRLWLGALLALAAWGVVRLLDALLEGRRGGAHLVAGLVFVVNPYTVVYSNRTSVTLLGLAALPWLMLCAHRGLRDPRGWWWPAAIALIVASAGAGVNAAVTAWVLVGPLALVAYERLIGAVEWRAVRSFTLRTVVLGALASAWWVGPVLVQTLYGIDFLQFTEQPGAIWSSTSLTESLRLMGYWPSYLGLGSGGYRPFYDTSPDLLFSAGVLVASLLVPALSLLGFAAARRWRYGPLFLGLVLLGLLVMTAGFPPGAPLRQGLTFTYNHLSPVQFLRTTHKAGPLVALGLACLAGYGAAAGWRRAPRPAGVGLAAAGAVLLAVSVWPLVRGRAIDDQLTYAAVPPSWLDTADDLDRGLAPNSRAVVLPGQLLAFYDWGQTVDPILPALTDRPVAVRQFVPRSNLRSVDLLWTVDALVQQERLVPGQLRPLLGLMGAGALVTATDDDTRGSGAIEPADAARALATQGLGPAEARHGAERDFSGADGAYEPPVRLPEVSRQDLGPGRGIVRVLPGGPRTIVDGSADALAGLAAFGALPARRPVSYAADSDASELRSAAREGAEIVVSDSNRRRVFVPARLRQNVGPTLAAGDPVSEDGALLDPFPERGDDARTVAVLEGARSVRAPFSPSFAQFPANRAYAAFDGLTDTEWLGDSNLEAARRYLDVEFESPRDVSHIDVLPAGGAGTAVVGLEVAGKEVGIHPGWNHLALGLRQVRGLRLLLRGDPARADLRLGNGLAEVRIPGVRVRERLRPPTVVESALAGEDLGRSSLTYLFSRTTADRPFRRDAGVRLGLTGAPRAGEDPAAGQIRDARDPEREITRVFSPPAERSYALDAWLSVAPDAPDDAIDRLAGMPGTTRFRSSGRFEGLARHRASSAFDGDPQRAWVSTRLDGRVPFLAWRAPRATAVRRLQLSPAALPSGRPTKVRLSTPTRSTPSIAVGSAGEVVLPATLRGRRFRLDVLEAAQPPGGRAGSQPSTVAIAEVRGDGVPRARVPVSGRLSGRCDQAFARVGGRSVGLRPSGTVEELEAGEPLRARGCGPAITLARGEQRLSTRATLMTVHHLRLRSKAPRGLPDTWGGGAVLDAGEAARGSHDGVRVRVDGPAWLVLGESYDRGWRASCDGDDLGQPEPVDGFANGWRPPRDCSRVAFRFAPQRAVNAGYGISAVVCLALLGFVLARRRSRRSPADSSEPSAVREPTLRGWPLRRALVAGAIAALVFGFVFALRAGPPAGALVALVLWRGLSTGVLVKTAALLLGVVVPIVYLLFGPTDRGGYNSSYAQDLLGAHWVAVAAFVLLALAFARSVSTARARRGARGLGPRAAASPRSPA